MDGAVSAGSLQRDRPQGSVQIASRSELAGDASWWSAFATHRKDRRFYEIVEDTIHPEFDHRYFVIKGERGETLAVQPFFILDQDLVVGTPGWLRRWVEMVRRLWPRLLKMRTLMVGCVAGEAHMSAAGERLQGLAADILAASITRMARELKVALVVLKEFPAHYRGPLEVFTAHGFARVPSLPMVKLGIEYPNFERYMVDKLSKGTRAKLRQKFRAVDRQAPLELSIIADASAIVDDIYPLYLAVYDRSPLHFEKLTKEFFSELGKRMPDKVRFFIWRQAGRIVCFSLCMIENDAVFSEYIGLDYKVAFDLHLYYVIVRDVITWAIGQGLKAYRSSALNYEPKHHLRCLLDPIDLYVRHTSPLINPALKVALPLLEPTRYDKMLQRFENFADLRGGPATPEARATVPQNPPVPETA
jgi:predicted N-acyltransferase